jgi:hypothetical protein
MTKQITFFTIFFSCFLLNSCDADNEELSSNARSTNGLTEWECGTHNGNTLFTGPREGCYYKNSNGNKTYVDRSECQC